SYTQKTVKNEGPTYQDNEVDGVHVLKLDEDGKWKIADTELVDQRALDENGEVIDESDMADGEMEGQYVEELQALDLPINEEDWEFLAYDEAAGTGFAYFAEGGDLNKQFGAHIVKSGAGELAALIDQTEQSVEENITNGDIEFKTKDMTDEEGFYEFTVTNDDVEEDQYEVGRAFVLGDDLYLVRYMSIGEEIEDKEEWIEKLDRKSTRLNSSPTRRSSDISVEENITNGDIEFKTKDMTDEEGFYEFTVTNDDVEEDQYEVGRAFVLGDDLYLVRYMSIGEEIEDKEEWIEKLKQVK